MTKDDVGPITEFGKLMGKIAGEEIQTQVMTGSEAIASAAPEEVAAWLKAAVQRLDALVDEPTRAQIMTQMGCNCAAMNKAHVEKMWAKQRKFETLDAFIAAEEKRPSRGSRLVRDGNIVYQFYTPRASFKCRCYCGLWRGLPDNETVSATWCQCSKGFVATVWEGHVGHPVKVELVNCALSGGEECQFAIHLDG